MLHLRRLVVLLLFAPEKIIINQTGNVLEKIIEALKPVHSNEDVSLLITQQVR